MGLLAWYTPVLAFAVATAACLGMAARHVHWVRETGRLAARLDGAADGPSGSALQRLRNGVDAAEHRLRMLDDRLDQRHRITGLPTREPLIARMRDEGRGTLGIISFEDFDRMAAFDPILADWALQRFAERIVRMIGDQRLLAHVDRCQFVLWFGADVAEDGVESQLAAIRYALGEVISYGERKLVPEARVHHASYAPDDEPPQIMLARVLATAATGVARPAGPGGPAPITPSYEHDSFTLEQDLRSALPRGEFELQFQPQIDAARGQVIGAEALLRWNSPDRGMVSPNLFVPLLESGGMIVDVGLWVLNAACRELRTWQALRPDLSVAVNVSSHQLESGDLHKRIERTLEAHAISVGRFEIELTESAAADDASRASLFNKLRSSGIRVAIDDFGTGYSSLSALRTLSFDKIKIDREFVTEVERRRDSQAICQSIIALGRGLGIRVLAEGVERHEEYVWLRQHGCNEFQGFLFARPMTSASFKSFLGEQAQLRTQLAVDPRHMQDIITQRLGQ